MSVRIDIRDHPSLCVASIALHGLDVAIADFQLNRRTAMPETMEDNGRESGFLYKIFELFELIDLFEMQFLEYKFYHNHLTYYPHLTTLILYYKKPLYFFII